MSRAVGKAAVGARRSLAARGTLFVPCLALPVAFVLLTVALFGGAPDGSLRSQGFVGGPQFLARDQSSIALHAGRKVMITDRQNNQAAFQQQIEENAARKKAAWDLGQTRDAPRDSYASSFNEQGSGEASEQSSGGGFSFPSFNFPAPAPAPAPVSVSAPSSEGGNPFQFILDALGMTTTTTTTTPPPNPIESFFKSLGFR
mmetsp:Transcript_14028/g.38595  ORF Transcript_14028/g.38595 Transcript_14028/m.38595 type:complete len:201 (+) Transcript_14028:70-672(+)